LSLRNVNDKTISERFAMSMRKALSTKEKAALKGSPVSRGWPGSSSDSEGWGADVSKPFDEPGRRGNLSIYGIQYGSFGARMRQE